MTNESCAHASVKRDTHGWRCDDCLRMFFPSGDTGCEQLVVQMRAALQKAVNLWDNYRIDSTETERNAKAECEALISADEPGRSVRPLRI
jgi:hypothetical protein